MHLPGRKRGVDDTRLRETLSSRNYLIVHLTHNDLDAVGADSIHRIKYRSVFTIWSSVGKFPFYLRMLQDIEGEGRIISISDIGYSRGIEDVIKKVKRKGWRIEWRDHHRWQDDELRRIEGIVSHLTVDTTTCACGICAKEITPGDEQAGMIAKTVCDYDLWLHKDPRSAVLGLVLQREKNREYVRDLFLKGILTDQKIESEYSDIKRDMERKMQKSLDHAVIQGKSLKIGFAPMYGYPSETAHFIRDSLKTDMEVIISPDGRFSLRSVPPISHIIAREYKGGGHPVAAGGTFRFSFMERISYSLLHKSRHFEKFSALAESIKL